MRRRSKPIAPVAALSLFALLAACNPAPSATVAPPISAPPTQGPSEAPTDAPSAVPSASAVAADPFAGEPFVLSLPAGWSGFNLQDPTAQAAIDQFAASNPNLAASIQAFKALPGVRMAVNPTVGNILLVLTTPSNGIAVDTIATSFNTQFQNVPGLQAAPSPEPVTLAGGNGIHWQLLLSANNATGGTVQVSESIYLLVSSKTAVILEFVVPQGGAIPDESNIVNSFKFAEP